MTGSVRVVWDPGMTAYDFGPDHPMQGRRLDLTIALAEQVGVLAAPGVEVTAPPRADDELLCLAHQPEYVDAVRRGSADVEYGLGDLDDPTFQGMHDAAALVVGGSVAAASAVWRGESEHAVNIAGGLHHAMPDRAAGFCIYNDPVVAIRWLLGAGAERVAYVDVDVHHGDGVQAAFYDDPRVLTVSVHESGEFLFPGTGWADQLGHGAAEGTAVNLPLPPGTLDAAWLRAFHAVVPSVVRAFAPQVLVAQCGCDAHALDPLADLALTVDGMRVAYATLHRLAHEVCAGRWVALGGGGYEHTQVVPRAWTLLIAEAAGVVLAPQARLPESWRSAATARTGEPAPLLFTDGGDGVFPHWEGGHGNRDDPVDRAIETTRRTVLPLYGLDPMDSRD